MSEQPDTIWLVQILILTAAIICVALFDNSTDHEDAMPSTDDRLDWKREGAAAWQEDGEQAECPYAMGTDAAFWWHRGYRRARQLRLMVNTTLTDPS